MSRAFPVASIASSLLVISSLAAAEGDLAPVSAATRPAYQVLRQDEDWSVLRSGAGQDVRDLYDPVKFVALDQDGSSWASFGGQVRLRLEGARSAGFGAAVEDDGEFALSRIMFHTDLHLGEHVRAFAEARSSLVTDHDLAGGENPSQEDEIDLHNAFLDLSFSLAEAGVTVRGGRQSFVFGKGRLVHHGEWANTRQSFDGASAVVSAGPVQVTGWWTVPVVIEPHDFNRSDSATSFYGIYGRTRLPGTEQGLELYWLGLDRDDMAFNGSGGDESRHTLGGRIGGLLFSEQLDWDVEGAYQLGEVGSRGIDAFMVSGEAGWTFSQVRGSPRLMGSVDVASGDDHAGGSVQTFNGLFGDGHGGFGDTDAVGRQNVLSFKAGVTWSPVARVTLGLFGFHHRRASDDDALYDAGGAVSRAGNLGTSKTLGHEINLGMTYEVTRHLKIESGYNYFIAGRFIEQSGRSEDIKSGHLTMTYTF
jgi:hypothetical protein